MKVLTVVLAICMLSIIGCSNDEETFAEGEDAYRDEDYKTALALLTPLAEDGHAEAQGYLGHMYSYGKGVPANSISDSNAVYWYTLSAEQGNAVAQLHLGYAYWTGKGVPENHKTAVYWYTLSAEQGGVIAMYRLGWAYKDGKGVPQNKVYAHMWFNLGSGYDLEVNTNYRDEVAEEMTAEEIATAERLAVECVAKEYKGCMTAY